jgi:diketogulonate reductase-like aldo/keto reductase
VKSLAATHSCTPAQLLFAYALCQGISVLPRTTNVDRVKENVDSVNVKLSNDEIKQLTELGEKSEKKYCWDPR